MMLQVAGTAVYRYTSASAVANGAVRLSTFTPAASPVLSSPCFFSGFVTDPVVAARGILAVARVAAARYFVPAMTKARAIAAADPVVTCDGERLRFESFSHCCGVHARLDIEPDGLEPASAGVGTTNVDVNPPLRNALTRLGTRDPLRLHVDDDQLVVDTLDGTLIEKQVPLPDRWLRGFAETQVAESRMHRRLDLTAVEARRLLQSVPRSSTRQVWLLPTRHGTRIAASPAPGGACLGDPGRLAALSDLLRLASRVSVFGPEATSTSGSLASAWVAELPAARFTLVLSAEASQGFSGDGGVLSSLASPPVDGTLDAVRGALEASPLSTAATLADDLDLGAQAVGVALDHLAAGGLVGYDLARRAYFERRLPFEPALLAALNPRLAGSLAVDRVELGAGGRATVVIGDHRHDVKLPTSGVDGATCTCIWYARHRGQRGPCKHVLAARRASNQHGPGAPT